MLAKTGQDLSMRRDLALAPVGEGFPCHVIAERAISLELLFVEELITSAVMREVILHRAGIQHRFVLAPGQAALHVDQPAIRTTAIVDTADGDVPLADAVLVRLDRRDVDIDVHRPVDAREPHEIAEAGER